MKNDAATKQRIHTMIFARAPELNPARTLITGVICGVRVEDIKDPTIQAVRYLDKLIDELGRAKRRGRFCGNKASVRHPNLSVVLRYGT